MKKFYIIILCIFAFRESSAQDYQSVPNDLTKQLHIRRELLDSTLLTYTIESIQYVNPALVRKRIPGDGAVFVETHSRSKLQIGLHSDTLLIRRQAISSKIVTDKGNVITEETDKQEEEVIHFVSNYAIFSISPTFHYVYKCRGHCAYFDPVGNRTLLYPIMLVFLAGLDPIQLASYKVEQVKAQEDKWIIFFSSRFSNIHWKVEIRKRDALPILCEFGRPGFSKTIKVTNTTSLRGHAFPSEVVVEEVIRNSATDGRTFIRVISKYILTSIGDYKGEIEIPLGVPVADYRLLDYEAFWDLRYSAHFGSDDQAVVYPWSGRLPSEAELQQLAYQQGHLIPPDDPARRYSLWMFLPAAILFGLAGYLYYRQKRK